MNLTMISSAFQTLVKFYNQAQRMIGLYSDSSLADLTRLTKVEPYVIISKDLMSQDFMPDLANGLLNYVIADYSQAIDILCKVRDIEVIKILDKLNPSRDATSLQLMASTMESRNSAMSAFSFPTEHTATVVTMEAKGSSGGADDAYALAVGKQVNIGLDIFVAGPDGEKVKRDITMPIAFRLLPRYVASPNLLRIMGYGVDDTGPIARFNRLQDGGINAFTDFFMASDLIAEARKAMIKDDSRALQDIMKRVATNKKIGMMTNNPSLVTLSNIFIMTESEAAALEAQFGGKMTQQSIRNKIFQNVYASTLVVVNRQWNNVTFWQRGMDAQSEITFKELKSSNSGGKSTDLFDMMKSFNLGMGAGF